MSAPELDLAAIEQAAERIRPYARRTPVITSSGLDALFGCRLRFKCENLQKTGAFKFRGACNAVLSLPRERLAAGVATHSSGNHAAALALAARLRGARAHVVMPGNANPSKRAAVEAYGASIRTCESTQEAREAAFAALCAELGCEPVPPYDDLRVIAGQGTATCELLEEVPDLEVLLVPLGGGGLLSGALIAARELSPRLRVIGVEPAGADDARRSLDAGRIVEDVVPETIADGLRARIGRLTFPIIAALADDVVTVSEAAIAQATRLLWQRLKLVVEPSGAVPVAALIEGCVEVRRRRVGVLVSGGNVDLDVLPWAGMEPR